MDFISCFCSTVVYKVSIISYLKTKLSECGDQASYIVPELFQLGAHGYAELCLVAWCCTPPISGYMLAKRTQESHPCCKERSPIKISKSYRRDLKSGFDDLLRDPIKYIFPFVLIALFTMGWIVALILCSLAEESHKKSEEPFLEGFTEETYTEEPFLEGFPDIVWKIFGCLFGSACFISSFVLLNLYRQRRSVS